MAKRGVATLYFETSNYQMRQDIVNRARVARFVEAAHANGMQIVAWYLPSFRDLARDKRRSLAAINFKTPGGEQFDSFALDIESSLVKPAATRSARLVTLSRRLRAAEPDLPLGAIVPAPRGMQRLPWYWPGFPFVQLAKTYDVFLPMGYFTYRSKLPSFTGVYTQLNITLLRTLDRQSRAAGAPDRRDRRRSVGGAGARVRARGAGRQVPRREHVRLRHDDAGAVARAAKRRTTCR